jgi:LacI family transcriptional regulator
MSLQYMPHMADVAKHARVAVATVSNVLNRPERVSPATRVRVESAIVELGYVPNDMARQLRGIKSRLIGMLTTELGDHFQLQVAQRVEAAASGAGRTMLHCQSHGLAEREIAHLEFFHERRAEGVVVVAAGDIGVRLLRLESAGTAGVIVNPQAPAHIPSVGVDHEVGGSLAASHLIDQGCNRIAFVGTGLGHRHVARRLAGAAAAASSRGVHLEVLTDGASNVAVGKALGSMIAGRRSADRPNGIVADSDALALGLMQGLVSHGIDVPHDVALVGYDDTNFASNAAIPLTSVRQPAAAVGAKAFDLLWQQIEHKQVEHLHQSVEFPPELVVRSSSQRA